MKNLTVCFLAFVASASLLAAPADRAALREYALNAVPLCPGGTLTLAPVEQRGPAGFQVYRVTQQSSDQYCGGQYHLLYSPTSSQTFFGTVIQLPTDPRPLETRLATHVSSLLKAEITPKLSPMTLADGLKPVSLMKQTNYGPFPYKGYIDASQNFLLVGMLGKINEPPAQTLRRHLGLDSAARRGNGVSKVEIIELSDFQCPTCAKAHDELEPLISNNLGKLSYARLDLPLFDHHEWAISASMGARSVQRVAPAKYWSYVDHVFKNQQQIGSLKFDTFFKDWVQDNDISWTAVEKIYKSTAERQALLDQVARAFAAGIVSTPTIIVNGQRVGYGDPKFVQDAIKTALGTK